MKKIVDIRNESGFGLIHVLAVTLIVSIAILGLFMSIEYARAHANLNYHSRSAMLIAQGYLEEIKYNNRNSGLYSRPIVNSGTETCTLDDSHNPVLHGQVKISTTSGGVPFPESGFQNLNRDEVYIDITWKENPVIGLPNLQNKTHKIRLQENYYWKRSGVSAQ